MGKAAVDVFRFSDYREFLGAFYEQKKRRKSGYSLRAFSRRVGLGSPNYLQLVIDGKRNLSPALDLRFAGACELEGESAAYFCALVAYRQAKGADERELQRKRLLSFQRYRKVHKLAVAQQEYHSQWYVPAIRELALREDFQGDPAWIARTLLPKISSRAAARALRVLSELGLLVRDESGTWVQAEPLLDTEDQPLGDQIVRYHREMMRLASESIERVPRAEREIASLTLCLSPARMEELKAELERIEQDLLQRFGSDDAAERVVQLNFQLFPLSVAKE
ncbi:MAG: TIGR02147 family protein [Myxococcales bacterium]|nr:TIGR02147 family protein [Myxococcales bacterium]